MDKKRIIIGDKQYTVKQLKLKKIERKDFKIENSQQLMRGCYLSGLNSSQLQRCG